VTPTRVPHAGRDELTLEMIQLAVEPPSEDGRFAVLRKDLVQLDDQLGARVQLAGHKTRM